jgi:TonB family protein
MTRYFVGLGIVLMMLVHGWSPGLAQKVPNPKKCAPIATKSDFNGSLPQFKGKKYVSPVIAFDIDEAGTVSNVVVKRGSGDRDFDSALKDAIANWKYKPQPGCGIRNSEMIFSIHFMVH